MVSLHERNDTISQEVETLIGNPPSPPTFFLRLFSIFAAMSKTIKVWHKKCFAKIESLDPINHQKTNKKAH
jgi:hypothetical protein